MKSHGQVAYEAGAQWLMKEMRERDAVPEPEEEFADWADLDECDKAYWNHMGEAVVSYVKLQQRLAGQDLTFEQKR